MSVARDVMMTPTPDRATARAGLPALIARPRLAVPPALRDATVQLRAAITVRPAVMVQHPVVTVQLRAAMVHLLAVTVDTAVIRVRNEMVVPTAASRSAVDRDANVPIANRMIARVTMLQRFRKRWFLKISRLPPATS